MAEILQRMKKFTTKNRMRDRAGFLGGEFRGERYEKA
jgi:hypothetical protein